ALLRRATTGMGCSLESSLLGSADLLMQAASTNRGAQHVATVLPTGEGLLAVECHTSAHRQALSEILGKVPLADEGWENTFSLSGESSKAWVSRLRQGGIPCSTVVNNLAD